VLILADDMGFSDIGCYGGEVSTPNIDKLAQEGLRFSQFYNSARCCPSRASLLTGLYPHQAGIGWMARDFGYDAYRGRLNDKCVTIAEVLKQAGYSTYMSGKWHVGTDPEHWPLQRGFDRYFGLITGTSNYFDLAKSKAPGKVINVMAEDNEPYAPTPGKFYMTDAFTDKAVKFLDEHEKDCSFFLYLSYTAPHWPLHAWSEDIAEYKGKYMKGWDAIRQDRLNRLTEMGLLKKGTKLTPRDPGTWPWSEEERKQEMDLKMAIYAAQIECMDRGIGQVLKKLEQLGKRDNTLIMFLSDNGATSEWGPRGFDRRGNGLPPGGIDSYMSYGFSWANASNAPFREYKTWHHEGGIATPFIARWPGVIGGNNAVTHQVGHIMDVMTTCVDAAGAEYPATHKGSEVTALQGKSLMPIFRGNKRKGHDALFWEHEGNRAVRKGNWKIVSDYQKEWELYDMANDRTELNDLAEEQPRKVSQLAKLYEQWAKQCHVLPWDDLKDLYTPKVPLKGVK
jgi:arylsulfatase